MNLLKSMILEENEKGKCPVCFGVLGNNDIFFLENDSKIFFCSKNCKVEWLMKTNDLNHP